MPIIDEPQNQDEKSDKIILGCIAFMVIQLLLGQVIPYEIAAFRLLTGILWGILPIVLAFAIKNEELRPIAIGGGAIYAAFQVYWQLTYMLQDF